MLWKFRREIVLMMFVIVSFWIFKNNLSFNLRFFKKEFPKQEYSSEIQTIILENENLKKLLNLKNRKNFSKVIYANVKTISPWVFPTLITIDKGSYDGIKENMAIISCNGSLVGRIVSVNNNTAMGITLYHSENKISAMVRETGELAVIESLSATPFHPRLRIRFLPPECKAYVGNVVETSGFTRLYPSGITIGTIVEIESSKTEPVTQGLVKPFFINDNLRTVAIVE
ncbi:MAG: rod shape-determining protein MreC [Candidatus Omnitrophica bacterium]|nr:rod shape-determining protein MreC [Candidatus Omnitrophota bacterium]